MKELLEGIRTQNQNRKEWVGADTAESIAQHILDEAEELVESITNFPVKRDAEFETVSEIGDILYLTLKLCVDLGIDPVQAIEMKLLRNSMKYPDHIQTQGLGYEESRKRSKQLWKEMGGDHDFFLAYTEVLGDEDD